jgi:hypothetical protein
VITQVAFFRDGGTIGFRLTEPNGVTDVYCFDYRIGSLTKGRLFLGAHHASAPEAQLVSLGDAVQEGVLTALRQYLAEPRVDAAAPDAEVLQRFEHDRFHEAIDVLERLSTHASVSRGSGA